jgi:hypothetical protein
MELRISRQEIADLLGVIDRDLVDCQASSLSADWRFNIAYNAALQSAAVALAAAGYRATRDSHHYRTLQSLVHTIGASAATVAVLDQFRKKRNVVEYERSGLISKLEADEMVRLALELRDSVLVWLNESHPELAVR